MCVTNETKMKEDVAKVFDKKVNGDTRDTMEEGVEDYKHCNNHSCQAILLEPTFGSILELDGSCSTNKQARFLMYSEAILFLYEPCLGKKHNKCV